MLMEGVLGMKDYKKTAVLVIEDEPDIRAFASRVLELEGCHVLQAENGEEGLRVARESKVSLVLLDLRLPGLDGWAVLEQLKSELELSSIPIIVLTASAAKLDRSRALAAGIADYIVKPVSAASLRKSVIRRLHSQGGH